MPIGCEWNPDTETPALCGEESHAEATLLVGGVREPWMLCASCADLRYFKGLRRKELHLHTQPTTEKRG